MKERVGNFINGEWTAPRTADYSEVINPATGEVLATCPQSGPEDVSAAVEAASAAFPGWRSTPAQDRVQYLFRLKRLVEEHYDEIASTTTRENGKTLTEARAELQRGVENIETACSIPTLMQGYNSEDVARGIDEIMIRQPLGVVAA